jgi:hypothetical protein
MEVDRKADDVASEALYIYKILLRVLRELYLTRAIRLKPAGEVHPATEGRL